jgi:hypothetical protein
MIHRPLDLVSATCRIEVNAIVALLQAKYDLSVE